MAAVLAAAPASSAAPPRVCAECVRTNEARLAGDEFAGRGCGSAGENAAARFLAAQLKAYGLAGAAPDGGFLQTVQFRESTYREPPTLEVGGLRMVQGGEILAVQTAPEIIAPLARVGLADVDAAAGKVALYDAPYDLKAVSLFLKAGARAVITQAPDRALRSWSQIAARSPDGVQVLGVDAEPPPVADHALVFVRPEAMAALNAAEGQTARLLAPRGEPVLHTTYNVLARLPGRGPQADREAVLLTAHYDHLGLVAGQTYRGANDDASGTSAVLEFARMLAQAPPHRRTAQFALFGCEEAGGHGAKYFLSHPSAPLADVAVNLEFEMIGAVDPRHPKRLMLTGWERSNLGPALEAHGAAIGPDIDPDEHFFERSDNIQLARRGVVAQTISAWPKPPTYHQPSDDLAHLDQAFMIHVIQSLAGPVDWLLNSDFKPAWNPGGQP